MRLFILQHQLPYDALSVDVAHSATSKHDCANSAHFEKYCKFYIFCRSHGRLVIFAFVAFSFFCTRVCTCESNYTSAVLRFWGSAILPSFCSWASACLFFCVLCVAALLRFFVSVSYALLLLIIFVVAFLRFYVSAILRFCGFAFLRFSGAQACSEQKKQHIHAYQNKFCTFCKPIGFSFAKRNSPFCQNKQFYKLQILQNKILQILQKQTNLVNLANSANQKQNHPQILKKYTKINSAILQTLPNNKFGKLFGNSPFCKFCTVRLKIPQILHFSVFAFLWFYVPAILRQPTQCFKKVAFPQTRAEQVLRILPTNWICILQTQVRWILRKQTISLNFLNSAKQNFANSRQNSILQILEIFPTKKRICKFFKNNNLQFLQTLHQTNYANFPKTTNFENDPQTKSAILQKLNCE